ncbi:MAG: formylglycine-generating enzyme family protein, partial [Myxococcaceae bacterium]|nr:formylglycine-generating enzyme family protein [Myxococcaceae bacterium]
NGGGSASSTGGGSGATGGGTAAAGGGTSGAGGGSASSGGGTGQADSGMSVVPAGPFLMGSTTGDADEKPVHEVTLSRFEIDRTEVTQAAYGACVTAGSCTAPSANFDPVGRAAFPVVNVSWAQAQAFCAFLGKRLPTEAEWEKAARGPDGGTYPWGEAAPTCALATTSGCGDGGAQPVGQLPAGQSPYGVLDLAGNVWEFTADWYADTYYSVSPLVDPQGPDAGTIKAYRGGSAGNGSSLARSANRASTYSPAVGGSGLGFRCAR